MQHLFFISRLFAFDATISVEQFKVQTEWHGIEWNETKIHCRRTSWCLMPKIKIQIKLCDTFFYVIQVWISHSRVYDCGSDCDCWCLLRKIRFNTIKVVCCAVLYCSTHCSRLHLFQFNVATSRECAIVFSRRFLSIPNIHRTHNERINRMDAKVAVSILQRKHYTTCLRKMWHVKCHTTHSFCIEGSSHSLPFTITYSRLFYVLLGTYNYCIIAESI